MSRDPLRFDGGDINLLRSFSNAPLSEGDPLGLFVRSVSLSLGEYGDISGKISSSSDMSWNPPTGGVKVSLSYNSKNCKKCQDLRWKQTITTSDPTCGRTSPYVDNTLSSSCTYSGSQWYGGNDRYVDGFSVSDQTMLKTSTGLQFVDAPSRQFTPKRSISWKALLEVWCLPSDGGAWFSIGGLSYGFVLSPRRWTITEIK